MIHHDDPMFSARNRRHVARRLNEAADEIVKWKLIAVAGWLAFVLMFLIAI